jgi:ketosteroid isomerase-like protein
MAGNAETFLAGADAVNRGDLDAMLDLVDEEIHFEPRRAATEGAFHGHEGVRSFWEDTEQSFEVFELDYTDVRELRDGRVFALGAIRVRGRGSGVETKVPTGIIATYRDGRMTHFKDYGEHSAALAAAGLT